MGTYIEIKLKDKYFDDSLLNQINNELKSKYNYKAFGFKTGESLINDCHYLNNDPEGLKHNTDLDRPIKPIDLLLTFSGIYSLGYVSYYISNFESKDDLLNAVALYKWARDNGSKIDFSASFNYSYEDFSECISYHVDEFELDLSILT